MKRVLTAGILIPIAVGLVWWAPAWLLFVAILGVAGLSLWEFLGLAARMGHRPNRTLTYLAALGLCLLGWQQPWAILPGLVAGALLLLCTEAFVRENHTEVLPSAAAGFLGLLYVVLPFSLLLELRSSASGNKLVLLLLVLTWVGDAAAYYVGSALGRHKLAPRISPGKSVEGGLASLLASVAVGFWLVRRQGWFPDASAVHALTLPLALNLASQIGDLVESALKRGVGVKDSSQLLPGHGGLLDRVDGLLLALPTLWYYCFLVLPR